MTRAAVTLSLLLVAQTPLPAQVVMGPPSGIGFRYQGRNVSVYGFFATGPGFYAPYYPVPYGIVEQRVSVQVLAPTVVVPRRLPHIEEYDVSGVDLDRVPPSVIWGEREPRPEVARNVPRPEPRRPEPAPAARVEPKPPADELLEPRKEARAEARRLVEFGIRAFRAREYGVASIRFRQATALDPGASRAHFLLGFTEYALGQYRDAVRSLEEGLRLEPTWPAADFRPRVELYEGSDEAWALHRDRLLATHRLRPDVGEYLFLLGVIDWFGDRRREAVDWLRAARPRLPDPMPVDIFLVSPAAPAPPA
jgi:hypothetical protein